MSELKKCCENCGNIRCASSVVAYWWDECVESNFENHWMPLHEPPKQEGKDINVLSTKGATP